MNPSNWKETKEALATAMELEGDSKRDFLSTLSDEIRADVVSLLSADEHAESFINEPILVERGVVTDEPKPDAAEGEIIDGYRLLRKIGSGGMGSVYLADQSGEGFSQNVALKLIKRGMDTGAVLKRFLMERQILANLEHPNIARMLDGGSTADGLPYFVMEYVDGEELRDYCAARKLGLVQRLELFRKICDAVASAHQKLVVHRDLKPSNILVTKDGEPKLLDFGIAKLTSPDWNADINEATITQLRIMTPEYASPEQLAGEATATSTDIYSLGVILYELLTGERPHITHGKTPKEIAESVLSTEPPKPSTVWLARSAVMKESTGYKESAATEPTPVSTRETPEIVAPAHLQGDLDNIILKAMRREPERRYQSVQEFSEDIRRYLDGLPVNATADSRLYRFNKYFKRHRIGVIGTAVAAILLLTATAVTGWQYSVAQREKAAAERRFADTRALAKSVLYELYDAIDAIPGSTKAKELLALKAVEYLDRLAAEGSNDPYLLTELADGYQRIGDIQGGMFRSNLGQTAEAKNSYAKARSLREAVVASGASDPKFRFKLAMAYTKAAESDFSEANVKGYYENNLLALETLKTLETVLAGDEDFLFELGASYANSGRAAAANDDVDEGIEYFKKAEAILLDLHNRNQSDLTRAMAVSTVNDMIAELQSSFGRKAEASYYLKRSASYIFPLLEANPDNADVHRNAAVSYYSISNNACDLGSYDEAMINAEKAIEIAGNLLKRDDQNVDLRTLYAMALYSKGKILVRSGRPNEGLPILEDVLKRAKALQAGDSENVILQVRTAYVDDEIGRAYLAIGLAETNRAAKVTTLQKARLSLQTAYDSYEKYGNAMVGEEAQVKEQVAAEIAKCDAVLKAASKP
jgi:serine/threonine protein kinase